ncbi:MAG: methyltransferase domain-containing protein [Solirubrobacteraceae bacterium]
MSAGDPVRTLLRRWRRAPSKHDLQLGWWLEHWEPALRRGELSPPDALELIGEAEVASTYLARRHQQARAEVRRVLSEAAIEDPGFFDGKVVVDIGPGPLGFPDACPARVSIGVDPLADRYAEHGLLLPGSDAIYLATGGEHIPLVRGSADVVLARNSLDYADDPDGVIAEARRILAPGGTFILLFDLGNEPSAGQPNALTVEHVRSRLAGMTVVHEHRWDRPFARGVQRAVLVGRSPQAPGGA